MPGRIKGTINAVRRAMAEIIEYWVKFKIPDVRPIDAIIKATSPLGAMPIPIIKDSFMLRPDANDINPHPINFESTAKTVSIIIGQILLKSESTSTISPREMKKIGVKSISSPNDFSSRMLKFLLLFNTKPAMKAPTIADKFIISAT